MPKPDALRVMPVRRRNIDRQGNAVFADGSMGLQTADVLAAVDATVKVSAPSGRTGCR
jgi:hypothetical protein